MVCLFLDIQLRYCDDGAVSTSAYRKPTQILRDFSSHHPTMHEAAVVQTLLSTADGLSSTTADAQEEHTYIYQALGNNSSSKNFIDSVSCPQLECRSPCKTITLPCARGLSEALKCILSTVNVRVVYQPCSMLRGCLVRAKNHQPSTQQANVVYSIPYSVCPKVYVCWSNQLTPGYEAGGA